LSVSCDGIKTRERNRLDATDASRNNGVELPVRGIFFLESPMPQTMTIPTTITTEAAEYIRDLGLQEPFEQMLEHARQIIPGLHAFTVSLLPRYDEPGEAGIIIDAFSEDPSVNERPVERDWGRWQIETFSPNVWLNFTLFAIYVPAHER
jgi:hypothetical protein